MDPMDYLSTYQHISRLYQACQASISFMQVLCVWNNKHISPWMVTSWYWFIRIRNPGSNISFEKKQIQTYHITNLNYKKQKKHDKHLPWKVKSNNLEKKDVHVGKNMIWWNLTHQTKQNVDSRYKSKVAMNAKAMAKKKAAIQGLPTQVPMKVTKVRSL